MGMFLGNIPIGNLRTSQTLVVADFKSIHTVDAQTASTYEIATLANQIAEAFMDKSAKNIDYVEEVDPDTASTYEIAHALNRILLYLKTQELNENDG